MEGLARVLRLGRRKEANGATAPLTPATPLPRAPTLPHHWLTIAVARPGPAAAIPVANARVVVRPFPRGAARPEEPVARGTTGADGSFAVSLPPGRYAVYAQHEADGKAVTVTLEHAGRATLFLESLSRRATLTVEMHGSDGFPLPDAQVEVRSLPGGTHVARAVADADGVTHITLPPGAYELHVSGSVTRTFLEADTTVRITAEPQMHETAAPPPVSKYAQRARAATSVVAALDTSSVRDEQWN